MGKLTDVAIRAWIKAGERFEERTVGDELVPVRRTLRRRRLGCHDALPRPACGLVDAGI
jgi:hypothetical protein